MILGIDTSAYTTSVAAVKSNMKGDPVFDLRRVLVVPAGKRGLRQSEAVFQHIKNFERLTDFKLHDFKAVAVSSKPRPRQGSYMPVFRVGVSMAKMLAHVLQVPLYEFSHQEGHLAAGLWSTGNIDIVKDILAIHISGGTSDILEIKAPFEDMKITDLGCSNDLHAGQFVDRVGVRLGLKFPAGKIMDKLARQSCEPVERISSSVSGYNMSFSGPETAVIRLIEKGLSKEKISKIVFFAIARTLEKIIRYAYSKKNYSLTLIVGGVASNSIIKQELSTRVPYKICFCDERYSTDNAVGTALLGLNKHFVRRKEDDY